MLEGTLREFSLADVFGFLALTKKSGVLRVSSDHGEGEVHFREGQIAFATADSDRGQFGTRLLSAGLVTGERLADTLERHGDAGSGGLIRALLAEGAADETALQAFFSRDVEEAVFALLGRAAGTFHFEVGDGAGLLVTVTLPTDQVVAEAARRAGEWAEIRQAIPSLDAVVAVVPVAPQTEAGVTVGREAWHLLALADGARTVGDLMELTGWTEFAACRGLAGLVGAGLIEVRERAGETTLAQFLAEREQLRRLQQLLGADDTGDTEPEPMVEVVFDPEPQQEHPEQEEELPEPVEEEPEPPVALVPPAPPPAASRPPLENVDRVQVARELAALGLGEDGGPPARARPPVKADSGQREATKDTTLTRDHEITKGLLLRLIDGVREA